MFASVRTAQAFVTHRGILLLLLLLGSALANTQAQTSGISPEEHEAIVAVARSSAEQDLGKSVQLQIQSLHVVNGWAFVYARMTGNGGRPIDYGGTPFAEAAAGGGKSDLYVALLHRQNKEWQLREHSTGPTDAVWLSWTTQGAPEEVFQVPAD